MSNSQGNAGENVGTGGGNPPRSENLSGSGNGNGSGSGNGNGSGNISRHGSGSGGGNSGESGGGSQMQNQLQATAPPNIIGGGGSSTSSATALTTPAPTTEATNLAADTSPRESGDDSEDESEILEESPCGRWLKRREEVDQRDVPGIDCVHLAMDTDEGVEVVWNEVQYANLQELKSQEDKMRQVFENLLKLDHQNIVKFHRYWTDTKNPEKPRVIFITEYMSSGSLKQFLKRTRRNAKRLPLESWRRWCTQILSALSYLHSCTPPVIHGNLTCDSIFIQHNGLVKIGSVVPDAVHYSVRQNKADIDHGSAHHYFAPEYGSADQLTAAVDIYAFGMCALEMAALEIQPSSSNSSDTAEINEETILRTINSLENDLQRDLIFKCLRRNPLERPSANDLLFHPLLFEVHSLKLLAAHCLVFSPKNRTRFSETVIDGEMQRYNRPEVTMATITIGGEQKEYRLSDVPNADKLEKFVEDVKFGVYPLTAYVHRKPPPHFRSRAASPERNDSVKSVTPETIDVETRRIVNMMCSVKKLSEDSSDIAMTILLRMDDKMNRQLTCQVAEDDTAESLTDELVRLGFVHVDDREKIEELLGETLRGTFSDEGPVFGDDAQPLTFSATINEELEEECLEKQEDLYIESNTGIHETTEDTASQVKQSMDQTFTEQGHIQVAPVEMGFMKEAIDTPVYASTMTSNTADTSIYASTMATNTIDTPIYASTMTANTMDAPVYASTMAANTVDTPVYASTMAANTVDTPIYASTMAANTVDAPVYASSMKANAVDTSIYASSMAANTMDTPVYASTMAANTVDTPVYASSMAANTVDTPIFASSTATDTIYGNYEHRNEQPLQMDDTTVPLQQKLNAIMNVAQMTVPPSGDQLNRTYFVDVTDIPTPTATATAAVSATTSTTTSSPLSASASATSI